MNRLFRLGPLFMVLFLVGIPVSLVTAANLERFAVLYPYGGEATGAELARVNSWWANLPVHVGLHLPMLHGVVPNKVVPYAPSAFLDPAWSISLDARHGSFGWTGCSAIGSCSTSGRFPTAFISATCW